MKLVERLLICLVTLASHIFITETLKDINKQQGLLWMNDMYCIICIVVSFSVPKPKLSQKVTFLQIDLHILLRWIPHLLIEINIDTDYRDTGFLYLRSLNNYLFIVIVVFSFISTRRKSPRKKNQQETDIFCVLQVLFVISTLFGCYITKEPATGISLMV